MWLIGKLVSKTQAVWQHCKLIKITFITLNPTQFIKTTNSVYTIGKLTWSWIFQKNLGFDIYNYDKLMTFLRNCPPFCNMSRS